MTVPEDDTLQTVSEAAERYRNWGRWGAGDERGTLNLVRPEDIVAAARLVKRGKVFALAIPFDRRGPQQGGGRFNPIHTMAFDGGDPQRLPHGIGFADDYVFMPLQCATQWDALSHAFDRGRLWNGFDAHEVTSGGARRNGIEKVGDRFIGRGVLLDLARFKGAERLEPGYAITPADLDACIQSQGPTSRVGRGDFLLVRTGMMGWCKANGWGDYAGGPAAGLSFSTAGWLHEHEIAAVATDTWGAEVRPNELPNAFQPLHQVAIANIGLHIGEIFDLEGLAADCADDEVFEFLFVAPPLPITGAVGSPINPYAVK